MSYARSTGRFSDSRPPRDAFPSRTNRQYRANLVKLLRLVPNSGRVSLGFAAGYNVNPAATDAYSGATVADFNRVPI